MRMTCRGYTGYVLQMDCKMEVLYARPNNNLSRDAQAWRCRSLTLRLDSGDDIILYEVEAIEITVEK